MITLPHQSLYTLGGRARAVQRRSTARAWCLVDVDLRKTVYTSLAATSRQVIATSVTTGPTAPTRAQALTTGKADQVITVENHNRDRAARSISVVAGAEAAFSRNIRWHARTMQNAMPDDTKSTSRCGEPAGATASAAPKPTIAQLEARQSRVSLPRTALGGARWRSVSNSEEQDIVHSRYRPGEKTPTTAHPLVPSRLTSVINGAAASENDAYSTSDAALAAATRADASREAGGGSGSGRGFVCLALPRV